MKLTKKDYYMLGGGLLGGWLVGWYFGKKQGEAHPAGQLGAYKYPQPNLPINGDEYATAGIRFVPSNTPVTIQSLPWWETDAGISHFLSYHGVTCEQWNTMRRGSPEDMRENPISILARSKYQLVGANSIAISRIDAYCLKQAINTVRPLSGYKMTPALRR